MLGEDPEEILYGVAVGELIGCTHQRMPGGRKSHWKLALLR